MNKSVKDFTNIELKAIKCDLYEQIELAQSNLRAINTELAERDARYKESLEEKRNLNKLNENKTMEETIINAQATEVTADEQQVIDESQQEVVVESAEEVAPQEEAVVVEEETAPSEEVPA